MNEELVTIITEAVQDILDIQGGETSEGFGVEEALYGQNGVLDSVSLVTLVVTVEQAIEDTFGVSLSLADEKAMSQLNSPYRTISSLAAYASNLFQAQRPTAV